MISWTTTVNNCDACYTDWAIPAPMSIICNAKAMRALRLFQEQINKNSCEEKCVKQLPEGRNEELNLRVGAWLFLGWSNQEK
jgi:hypothetical protein